jgi:uncharacterized protein (DUF849 family)
VDVVLNLTTGPGAVFVPGAENPAVAGPGTTLCALAERIRHVLELKPEICTLDLNTMWFNTRAAINIPDHVAEMARAVQAIGVLPELEVFDSGDIQLAHHLIRDEVLKSPALFQIVLGIRFGAISTPASIMHMQSLLPADAAWAAFGISAQEYPMLEAVMDLRPVERPV